MNVGTLLVNGSTSASSTVTVANSAILGGTGTISGSVADAGEIAPGSGASTGILTTGAVTFSGSPSIAIVMNGSTVGSGYDKLSSTGAMNLSGVALSPTFGFTPADGTSFDIVHAAAISNTFSGYANGGVYTIDGLDVRFNYTSTDVTLTIVPVAITQSISTNENTAASGTLTASGTDSNPLTYAVVSGPTEGTLTSFNASTGAFTYTPTAGYYGGDSFTFTVTDNGATSASATVSITVIIGTPIVTGLSTTLGAVAGGTSVTVTGNDFNSATAVDFNSTTAATFTVNSSTSITAVAPAGTGLVDITVSSPEGTSATSTADQFTFVAPPVANGQSISTNENTAVSGTLTASEFDSNPLTYAIVSGPADGTLTSFNALTGAFTYTPTTDTFGSDSFTFTASDGVSTSTAATVSITVVVPVPSVSGVSPSAGPLAGSTSVIITGISFTGATAVDFGSTAATTFTVNSYTQITATDAAGTGVVDVTVATAIGTSSTTIADQFTYVAAPTVSGLSPTTGPAVGSTSVIITGSGFTGDATAVMFGSTAATTFTVNSATQIAATDPAGTGVVDVTVVTAGGTSATSTADQFAYVLAPTVTSVSPEYGLLPGGTSVVITGTGFTTATAVTFGSTAATTFTVNAAGTQITATDAAGTGVVDITVTIPVGGTSATTAADQFIYVSAPTVSGLSPTAGPTAGSTSVIITGSGFTGDDRGGFRQHGRHDLHGQLGHADHGHRRGRHGSGGCHGHESRRHVAHFDRRSVHLCCRPDGVGRESDHRPAAGGTIVTITGTDFTGATAVEFGSTAATTFTVNSATQITATDAAGTGVVDVTVATVGGTSATAAADQFTYVAAPTVTGREPQRRHHDGRHQRHYHRHRLHGGHGGGFRHHRRHDLHGQLGHADHGHRPGRHRRGGRHGHDPRRHLGHVGRRSVHLCRSRRR